MIKSFNELVRQPTGTHFLDSGDTYGRHWQKPALPKDMIVNVRAETYTAHDKKVYHEISASINLAAFLDANLEIDNKLTKAMRKHEANEDTWLNIFDAAEFVSELTGKPIAGRCDYTYNYENNLTQDFQYAVISEKDDWFYDDDAIVLIQSHNGCDARGGFSDVVACRVKGYHDGLGNLFDLVVGWHFGEGIDANGKELTHTELQELDEQFQVGYANNPTYRLSEEIVSVIDSNGGDFVTITLKTGETVKAYPDCRASYG